MSDRDSEKDGWTTPLMVAAAYWGAFILLISEILSVFNALTALWVTSLWTLTLVGLVGLAVWTGTWRNSLRDLWDGSSKLRERFPLSILPFVTLGALLFVIALLSPANSTDSLRYHMPRVLHWAQNASLRHYSTAYQPQLWNPPWAEIVILNLRLLWGSDRLANLVQWASMVGSLVGVAAIAGVLGASRLGRLAAVAFAISLPMGILQATSNQTDYVAAFWLICAAYFVVLSQRRGLSKWELAALGMAVGLGMLTKATYYVYVLPLLIWFVTSRLRASGWKRVVVESLWVAIPAILINAGFWSRNVATFGGPLGLTDWVQANTNAGMGLLGVGGYISSLIRATLMNFVTPSQEFNMSLQQAVGGIESALGVGSGGYEIIWGWNHEDLAGYPLHIALVVLTIALLTIFRPSRPTVWIYSGVALASYALVGLAIRYAPYNLRFQLAFFVFWAPVFGVALSAARLRWLAIFATPALLLVSLPWVFFNSTRPLIGMQPEPKGLELPCVLGCTRMGSIFEVPETDLLYANWRPLQEPVDRLA
ncbi:MAG: glycosyltransferase family 39 protein, partial [Anaerolineales bacterium]